jgi:predicted RNA-binding protein
MTDVARIVVTDAGVTCVNTIGDRTTVQDAELAEANLVRHEIILRPRKG